QFDGPNPIGKARQQVSRGLEAEPGLADAAGAGQGDEAMRGADVEDLIQLGIAANELGNRLWQVYRRARRGGCRWRRPRGCLRIRPCRNRADLAGKLVTAPGDRADQV